jgi:hypothetical protein
MTDYTHFARTIELELGVPVLQHPPPQNPPLKNLHPLAPLSTLTIQILNYALDIL